MPTTPLVFSSVTGLMLAALGIGLGSSGLSGWGLAIVGGGILALALGSWLQQARQPALLRIARGSASGYAGRRQG